MSRKCPNCGYERKPTDLTPKFECPQCSVIYEKYEKALQSTSTQDEEKKRCPFCGEQILSVAIKCKHCGEYLTKKPDIETKRGSRRSFWSFWNTPHRNLKIVLLLFFVLIGSIFLYFTPHLAVLNMKKAVEENDAERLSYYVDYPSLRESLKGTITATLANKIGTSPNRGFGEAIGAVFAVAFMNPLIDSVVTPEGLAALMKRKINKERGTELPETKRNSAQNQSYGDTSMGYKGFDQFIVKFHGENPSEEPVQFIFKRKGILSWKLSALRLPQNAFPDFPGTQEDENASMVGRVDRSRQNAAKAMISLLETALDTYSLDTGRYPTTAQGLEALRERPSGVQRWDGPYLPKDIPVDPWGNPYQYRCPTEHGDYDILSYGADGKPGGEGKDVDLIGP